MSLPTDPVDEYADNRVRREHPNAGGCRIMDVLG
jgi:hypothetical protein